MDAHLLARRLGSLALGAVLFVSSGCASTVKQATKEAAHTAVDSSVKELHDPTTREQVAHVLADPEIRRSTTQLSRAVADGVLDAVTADDRIERATATSEVLLARLNRTFAKSLEHDVSPVLASLIAATVEETVQKVNAERPALKDAVGSAAREVGRQAALGFQDAVVQSDGRQSRGEARPGEVLAAVGRASDSVVRTTSLVFWGAVSIVALAILGGASWLVVRLRQEQSANRDLRRRLAA